MKCKICNKEFKMITNTHLKFHNITIKEYKEKYGEVSDPIFNKERYDKIRKKLINKYGVKNPMHLKIAKDKISKIAIDRYANGFENWNEGLTKETDDRLKIHSMFMKNKWKNFEYRIKQLKKMRLYSSPNNLEVFFNELTPNEIYFVGNGDIWITLKNNKIKNPDFKVKGQKKIIELFGDYWHKGDNPEDLIKDYREIGFDCIIFWESDVYTNTNTVLEKTLKFINK